LVRASFVVHDQIRMQRISVLQCVASWLQRTHW
jgi:hypothetical protein